LPLHRIFIIGSDKVWSLERIYKKHLLALGLEVELFAAQNLFYDYYGKSIYNKIIFQAGFSSIFQRINKELLVRIKEFKPDLIWVFKGMEVLPETLKQMKAEGIKLVNYNPDNPFYFSGSGSGNKNVTDSISLYDAHFTYDHIIQETIRSRFRLPCFILPFGFELEKETYESLTKQEEVLKLCFLGNPDKDRVRFLEKVADKLPLDVFGNDWQKFTRHKNITVNAPVYGNDFWKTLYRYRVQLNLLRPHNPASHNMRSFEIPGAGGIGLYPLTNDHQEYFGNDGLAKLYSDIESCYNEACLLMNLTDQEAMAMRNNARRLSLEKGYDYFSRTKQFLAGVNEIVK
jgi:hypothetical protein